MVIQTPLIQVPSRSRASTQTVCAPVLNAPPGETYTYVDEETGIVEGKILEAKYIGQMALYRAANAQTAEMYIAIPDPNLSTSPPLIDPDTGDLLTIDDFIPPEGTTFAFGWGSFDTISSYGDDGQGGETPLDPSLDYRYPDDKINVPEEVIENQTIFSSKLQLDGSAIPSEGVPLTWKRVIFTSTLQHSGTGNVYDPLANNYTNLAN